MSRTQKRVKAELQESTRDFQRQLAELAVRIKGLTLKEEWIQAEHTKEDSSDTALIEQVDAAKKRLDLCLSSSFSTPFPTSKSFFPDISFIVSMICFTLTHRYSDLRRRYNLEMEGYQTEATQLRARLTQVERLYNHSLLRVSARFATPKSAIKVATKKKSEEVPKKKKVGK